MLKYFLSLFPHLPLMSLRSLQSSGHYFDLNFPSRKLRTLISRRFEECGQVWPPAINALWQPKSGWRRGLSANFWKQKCMKSFSRKVKKFQNNRLRLFELFTFKKVVWADAPAPNRVKLRSFQFWSRMNPRSAFSVAPNTHFILLL